MVDSQYLQYCATTDLPVDMGNKKTAPPWMAVENLLACVF